VYVQEPKISGHFCPSNGKWVMSILQMLFISVGAYQECPPLDSMTTFVSKLYIAPVCPMPILRKETSRLFEMEICKVFGFCRTQTGLKLEQLELHLNTVELDNDTLCQAKSFTRSLTSGSIARESWDLSYF